MKKYLKIATPAKLQADIAKKWPTVELTPELSGAKLAAIVIEAGDLKQRALAESICQRSSLKLPLIEVTAENIATDMKRILELATAYEKENVPAFLLDLINFADERAVSFTTPGHHNGNFYTRHPAGELFWR